MEAKFKLHMHSIMTVQPLVCLWLVVEMTATECQLWFHISALNPEHLYISCASHQCCAVDSLGFKVFSVTSGKLMR